MFKKISFVLATLAITSSVYATRIDEGTLEIGFGSNLDFVTENGVRWRGDLLSMYFIRTGTALGGRVAWDTNRDYSNLKILAALEQHLELESPLIPYLGVDVGLITCTYKNWNNDDWNSNWGWGGWDYWGDEGWNRNDGSRDYANDRLSRSQSTAMIIALRPGAKLYFTDMVCLDTSLEVVLASNKIFKDKRGAQNKAYNVGIRTGLRYAFF